MVRIMANSSNNNGQTPGIDPALISAQRLQPYVARCKGDVTVWHWIFTYVIGL